MIYSEFIELLIEQLAESSTDCRAVASLHEGLGLATAILADFIHEAKQPLSQQDPERLLEILVGLSSACARVATDLVLPVLNEGAGEPSTR